MASARLATAVVLLVLVAATGTQPALGCSYMPDATSPVANSPVSWISSKFHDLLVWLHVTSPDPIATRTPNAAEPSSTAASDMAAAPNDGGGSSDDTPDFADGDDATVRNHWALLVAGSNGWWNYRHQADVGHAYQVLIGAGFKAQHIVVMAYDDIAHAAENPHAGTIVNRPGGPNVYRGLKIDYRGDDVNAANFLAVLAGDAKAVRNAGNGRVIASGPHDRIFVFYSDHGSTGVLGMPTGPFLFADDLVSTLLRKRRSGGFQEAVLYIEACESGSMFEGLLPDDDGEGIYVTTASNAVESSWGTYCPGVDDKVPSEYSTCLGDLYSVAWMENAEVSDLSHETLKMQYDLVRRRTSNNDTFIMGSHVMQYGAYRVMQRELAGDYLGMRNKTVAPAVTSERANRRMLQDQQQRQEAGATYRTVEQRDADLVHWSHEAKWAKDEAKRAAAQARLDAAVSARQRADQAAAAVVEQLLHQKSSSQALLALGGWTAPQVYLRPMALTSPISGGGSGATNMLRVDPRVIDAIVSTPMGRPVSGWPAVKDWDCLRGMVGAWGRACGPMDQYSMKHTRLLANLCNAGLAPADVEAALAASGCSEPAVDAEAVAAA